MKLTGPSRPGLHLRPFQTSGSLPPGLYDRLGTPEDYISPDYESDAYYSPDYKSAAIYNNSR